MKRLVLLGAVSLTIAAPAAAWPGRPPNPPQPQGTSGPPPAWIESRSRSLWLAFSSFCWRTTCADYLPPQARPGLPTLRLAQGEVVRLHFAFRPTEVHATTFRGTTLQHATLRPGPVVAWRPRRSGVVSFDVKAAPGSASYVVRLVLR